MGVIFALQMKVGEMENVESIRLAADDVHLCFDVKNPLSDYEVREKVVVNPANIMDPSKESVDGMSEREPPHHFHLKWEGNKKHATLTVLDESMVASALKSTGKGKKGTGPHPNAPRNYTSEDVGSWVTLLLTECRGLEPSNFYPMNQGEFVVKCADSETIFQGSDVVDFSDGNSDWSEYDAQANQPVSISDIQFRWKNV
jgi:Eukaryotic protein of unknown function (DUF866)